MNLETNNERYNRSNALGFNGFVSTYATLNCSMNSTNLPLLESTNLPKKRKAKDDLANFSRDSEAFSQKENVE